MATIFRRIRNIGTVDLNSVEPIRAKYREGNLFKDVVFKQYDYGSRIHMNLDMSGTDIDLTGNIYATFSLNRQSFRPQQIITDISGKPVEQICPVLSNGQVEVLLPLEVMNEQGSICMELVIIENDVYRLTGPTITFSINKSISPVTNIPSRYTYIVDENGNYITDENGNYLIG